MPSGTSKIGGFLEAKASRQTARFTIDLESGRVYSRLLRTRAEWEGPQPYLSLYSDNYFDLFPGERKYITLEVVFPAQINEPVVGRLLASGHSLHDGIPVKNILHMFQVARKYGSYSNLLQEP